MVVKQMALPDIWEFIKDDRNETRFVARVFFFNRLDTYYNFIEKLDTIADVTVKLSDELFCKGPDTVPDLNALIAFLDGNKDKDVLIPHLGEYLRIGKVFEKNSACMYAILNRHVHSKKRVWIPIFLANDLFHSIVGTLDEERFGQYLIEIDETPMDFSATVFSKVFASQKEIVDVVGVRAWLKLWDDCKIKSGMSFATRQITQISPANGNYAVKVIADPYEFLLDSLVVVNTKLSKDLGTPEKWAALLPYVSNNCTMEDIIPRVLNMQKFEPEMVLERWDSLSDLHKWAFFLWYKLGLNKSSNYISYAVEKRRAYKDLFQSIECAILNCVNNSNFDEWLSQRFNILNKATNYTPSDKFMMQLDEIADFRIQLKILTGKSVEERAKIIELIAFFLKKGKSISDFKIILQEKYPDLLLYLKQSAYLTDDIQEYFSCYKHNKIADTFSLTLSEAAGKIDCLQFETRGSLLFSLKNSLPSAYFLWFDGLGVEWIDLLLAKVQQIDSSISIVNVNVGTAVLPTITKINMDKADPETISERKIDDLDTLSHIKDKTDCNYFSIVAKQFDLIGKFAQKIVDTIRSHPDMDIVVTADHGMSRLAAKGFHETQAVLPPSKSEVFNHGRYCMLQSQESLEAVSHTQKDGKILAFRTYNHFTFSGNAPGEIHGGATPEEILIPVIHFAKLNQRQSKRKLIGYQMLTKEAYIENDSVSISIRTNEPVKSLVIDINGEMVKGLSADNVIWTVKIKGLYSGRSYNLHVYPNNLSNQTTETIVIKKKGLVVDDDF